MPAKPPVVGTKMHTVYAGGQCASWSDATFCVFLILCLYALPQVVCCCSPTANRLPPSNPLLCTVLSLTKTDLMFSLTPPTPISSLVSRPPACQFQHQCPSTGLLTAPRPTVWPVWLHLQDIQHALLLRCTLLPSILVTSKEKLCLLPSALPCCVFLSATGSKPDNSSHNAAAPSDLPAPTSPKQTPLLWCFVSS